MAALLILGTVLSTDTILYAVFICSSCSNKSHSCPNTTSTGYYHSHLAHFKSPPKRCNLVFNLKNNLGNSLANNSSLWWCSQPICLRSCAWCLDRTHYICCFAFISAYIDAAASSQTTSPQDQSSNVHFTYARDLNFFGSRSSHQTYGTTKPKMRYQCVHGLHSI